MTVTHMTIDGEECSPDSVWDVIVVGTGLGGATIGHRLTQNGYRVLFLEKGKASFVYLDNTDVTGVQNPDDRLDLAHWPDRITTSIDGHQSDFFAPLDSVMHLAVINNLQTISSFGHGTLMQIGQLAVNLPNYRIAGFLAPPMLLLCPGSVPCQHLLTVRHMSLNDVSDCNVCR